MRSLPIAIEHCAMCVTGFNGCSTLAGFWKKKTLYLCPGTASYCKKTNEKNVWAMPKWQREGMPSKALRNGSASKSVCRCMDKTVNEKTPVPLSPAWTPLGGSELGGPPIHLFHPWEGMGRERHPGAEQLKEILSSRQSYQPTLLQFQCREGKHPKKQIPSLLFFT